MADKKPVYEPKPEAADAFGTLYSTLYGDKPIDKPIDKPAVKAGNRPAVANPLPVQQVEPLPVRTEAPKPESQGAPAPVKGTSTTPGAGVFGSSTVPLVGGPRSDNKDFSQFEPLRKTLAYRAPADMKEEDEAKLAVKKWFYDDPEQFAKLKGEDTYSGVNIPMMGLTPEEAEVTYKVGMLPPGVVPETKFDVAFELSNRSVSPFIRKGYEAGLIEQADSPEDQILKENEYLTNLKSGREKIAAYKTAIASAQVNYINSEIRRKASEEPIDISVNHKTGEIMFNATKLIQDQTLNRADAMARAKGYTSWIMMREEMAQRQGFSSYFAAPDDKQEAMDAEVRTIGRTANDMAERDILRKANIGRNFVILDTDPNKVNLELAQGNTQMAAYRAILAPQPASIIRQSGGGNFNIEAGDWQPENRGGYLARVLLDAPTALVVAGMEQANRSGMYDKLQAGDLSGAFEQFVDNVTGNLSVEDRLAVVETIRQDPAYMQHFSSQMVEIGEVLDLDKTAIAKLSIAGGAFGFFFGDLNSFIAPTSIEHGLIAAGSAYKATRAPSRIYSKAVDAIQPLIDAGHSYEDIQRRMFSMRPELAAVAEIYVMNKTGLRSEAAAQLARLRKDADKAAEAYKEAALAAEIDPKNPEATKLVRDAKLNKAKAIRKALQYEVDSVKARLTDLEKYNHSRIFTADAANAEYDAATRRLEDAKRLRDDHATHNRGAFDSYSDAVQELQVAQTELKAAKEQHAAIVAAKKQNIIDLDNEIAKIKERMADPSYKEQGEYAIKELGEYRKAVFAGKDSEYNKQARSLKTAMAAASKRTADMQSVVNKLYKDNETAFDTAIKLNKRIKDETEYIDDLTYALDTIGLRPGEVADEGRFRDLLSMQLEVSEQKLKEFNEGTDYKELQQDANEADKFVERKARVEEADVEAEEWRGKYNEFLDMVRKGYLDYKAPPPAIRTIVDQIGKSEARVRADVGQVDIDTKRFMKDLRARYGDDVIDTLLSEEGPINALVRRINNSVGAHTLSGDDITILNMDLHNLIEKIKYASDPNYKNRMIIDTLEIARKYDVSLRAPSIMGRASQRFMHWWRSWDPIAAKHGTLNEEAQQAIRAGGNMSHQAEAEFIDMQRHTKWKDISPEIQKLLSERLGLDPVTNPKQAQEAIIIGALLQYIDTRIPIRHGNGYAFLNTTSDSTWWERFRRTVLSDDRLIKDRAVLERYFKDLEDYNIAKAEWERTQLSKAEAETNPKPMQTITGQLGGPDTDADFSRVIQGKLGADTNRLIDLLGATMYNKPIAEVAIKELLQNGFDATKGAINKGKIARGEVILALNEEARTIQVIDNGNGMTPDIVQNALFTIGGTDKADIGTGQRSGGLGLAKMAFLFGSEWVDVVTIRDGVKTSVHATSAQIRAGAFDIVVDNAPGAKNQTSVKVKIPESYYDANKGENVDIHFPWGSYIDFTNKPLLGNIDLFIVDSNQLKKAIAAGKDYKQAIKEVATKHIDGKPPYPLFTKLKFSWGDADVYVGPKKDYPTHSVLSAGLYQFDGDFRDAKYKRFGYELIIDVKPKVEPTNPAYPFNNSREAFRNTIEEDIGAFKAYLFNYAKALEAETTAKQFDTAISMERIPLSELGGDLDAARESILKAFQKEQDITKANAHVYVPPTEIDITAGIAKDQRGQIIGKAADLKSERKVAASMESERPADNISKFFNSKTVDPTKPLFHNNTSIDWIAFGREQGIDVERFFSETGSIILDFKERLGKSNSEYSALIDNIYAAGVSIDKGYLGVHVRVPYKAFFVNPLAHDSRTPLGAAESFMHTLIHEAVHTTVSGHNEDFTIQLGWLYGQLADSADIIAYREAIQRVFTNNWDTFTKLRSKYDEFATKNVGRSIGVQEQSATAIDSGVDFARPPKAANSGQSPPGIPGNAGHAGNDSGGPTARDIITANLPKMPEPPPIPAGIAKPDYNMLQAVSRAWMPQTLTGVDAHQTTMLYNLAMKEIIKNQANGGTFLDFVEAMKKQTQRLFGKIDYPASRSYSYSAMAIVHGGMVESSAIALMRAVGGNVSAAQLADATQILDGAHHRATDVVGAFDALTRLGIPVTMGHVKPSGAGPNTKIPIKLFSAGKVEGTTLMQVSTVLEGIERDMPRIIKERDPRHIPSNDVKFWQKGAEYVGLLWKKSVVAGYVIPHMNTVKTNFSGNAAQIWFSVSPQQALRTSAQSLPDYFPFGEYINNMASRMSMRFSGVPVLGSMINAVANPLIANIWQGKAGLFRTKAGALLSYESVRNMIMEDGILDTFVSEEFVRVFTRKGESKFARAANWWPDMISQYFRHVEQRQRTALYLDLLYHGSSRHEARKLTLEALYDWHSTMSNSEMGVLAAQIPFLRYFTLAARQTLLAFTEPFTRPSESALRMMEGKSRLIAGRAQMQIKDKMDNIIMDADPDTHEVATSIEDQQRQVAQYIRPGFADDIGVLKAYKNSDAKIRALKTIADRDLTHSVIVLPPTTNVDMMNMGFQMLSGLVAMGLIGAGKSEYVASDWVRSGFVEPVSGLLGPLARETMESLYANYGNDPAAVHGGNAATVWGAEEAAINAFAKDGGGTWRDPETGKVKTSKANVLLLRTMPIVGTEFMPFLNDAYFKNPEGIQFKQTVNRYSKKMDQLNGTSDPERRAEIKEELHKIANQRFSQFNKALIGTMINMINTRYFYSPDDVIAQQANETSKAINTMGKSPHIGVKEPKYIGGPGADYVLPDSAGQK